ncbi:MAG TPA: DNA polymerase IV, partial [Solirubrobacterales bacterium]|nr:DNA polymerase IV [Solirubrobacterales bacterium]
MSFERTIAHLDMDAFYASVELRRRPELKGKPVVVCGSGPRAVVTTASYEARRLAGIHSAMPAAVARRLLPEAIYLTPDFPAYREASAKVMDVLRGNVEVVEVVGLDEAYLDLTGIFSPKATMRRGSVQIREETGLTCSVGISESRMLAKIVSELDKPAGLVVLSREQALE